MNTDTARTRIKLCGLTLPEEAQLAAHHGADAIGLVFYPKSPRAVSITQAVAIASVLPAFVSTVALVVDAEAPLMESIIQHLRPALLQFHGEETAQACARWNYPYLKALRMKPGANVLAAMEEHIRDGQGWCRGVLLDTYHPSAPGGTGEAFNWSYIPAPEERLLPLVLAGGLNPGNVENAVRQVRPWAVDVSSGVEYAPGRKCPELMRAFIQGVLNAAVPLPR